MNDDGKSGRYYEATSAAESSHINSDEAKDCPAQPYRALDKSVDAWTLLRLLRDLQYLSNEPIRSSSHKLQKSDTVQDVCRGPACNPSPRRSLPKVS
jgi:hypothetical protein